MTNYRWTCAITALFLFLFTSTAFAQPAPAPAPATGTTTATTGTTTVATATTTTTTATAAVPAPVTATSTCTTTTTCTCGGSTQEEDDAILAEKQLYVEYVTNSFLAQQTLNGTVVGTSGTISFDVATCKVECTTYDGKSCWSDGWGDTPGSPTFCDDDGNPDGCTDLLYSVTADDLVGKARWDRLTAGQAASTGYVSIRAELTEMAEENTEFRTEIEAEIEAMDVRIAANAADTAAVAADLSTFKTTIEGRVAQNERDITALQAEGAARDVRITTNKTDIGTNTRSLRDHETRLQREEQKPELVLTGGPVWMIVEGGNPIGYTDSEGTERVARGGSFGGGGEVILGGQRVKVIRATLVDKDTGDTYETWVPVTTMFGLTSEILGGYNMGGMVRGRIGFMGLFSVPGHPRTRMGFDVSGVAELGGIGGSESATYNAYGGEVGYRLSFLEPTEVVAPTLRFALGVKGVGHDGDAVSDDPAVSGILSFSVPFGFQGQPVK